MTEPTTLDEARSAKLTLSAALAGDSRINGIGIGYDATGYVLKVNLTVPDAADRVPSTVDGVSVRTEVVGTIRSL
jgi:hypothetical protein